MKLLGKTKVTTIEEPDYLQFVMIRVDGWIDLVAPPLILLVAGAWSALESHYFWALGMVVALFVVAAYHLNGKVTKLFVSQSELRVIGKLNTFPNEGTVPASEVNRLGYWDEGDEYGRPGSTCFTNSGIRVFFPASTQKRRPQSPTQSAEGSPIWSVETPTPIRFSTEKRTIPFRWDSTAGDDAVSRGLLAR